MIDFNRLSSTEREKNILMILDHIIEAGETSAIDTANKTGLSTATVSRAMALLKQKELVIETGKEITDMGRHPGIFSINPKFGYLLYFHLGSSYLTSYLADFSGTQLRMLKTKIDRSITIQEFCAKLRESADTLAQEQHIRYEDVYVAGISIPGLADEQNHVVKRIPNFTNFNNENMFMYACDALHMPVVIHNEARLGVVGEYITHFKNYRNLIYLDFTNYSGIGAGIILNGALYSGKNGFAGEIGDMLMDLHGFYGSNREDEGCLEAMAGVGVMMDRLTTLMRRGRANILKEILIAENAKTPTLEHIERAVLMQDLDVMDVFDETMKMWAVAAVNLAAMLDPDVLLLGGVVDAKNDVVLARINHYVSKILYYDLDIRLSKSHAQAQYSGGIHLTKKYAFNNILAHRIFQ